MLNGKVLAKVEINNAPLGKMERYTVCRRADDGSLWYFGTYDELERANVAVAELNNAVLLEVVAYD
jgi:hypothetical protein